MATEVLLMADVPDLGSEGQIVKVADGYARNYLIPGKLAAPVTKAARARLEKLRQEREAGRKAAVEAARQMADRLKSVSCTISAKTGGEEKLHGSVGAGDIAKALADQGLEIDRHQIAMDDPIRELGVFEVPIRLHAEVTVTIKVWVVEE